MVAEAITRAAIERRESRGGISATTILKGGASQMTSRAKGREDKWK